MTWDSQLQTASFGGISFDVVTSSDRLERRIVEHEYPYKDGADLEDTGRQARPTSFSAVFYGDGYLTKLVELQRLIDTGETRTLIHPLLGSWQAKAVSMSIEHDQSKRDAADVSLEFKEDGTNTEIPAIEAIGAAQQKLSEASTDLATSAADLDSTPAEVTALSTNAATYQADLASATDKRENRFDELDAYCKTAVKALDASSNDDLETWPVIRDIRSLQHAAREMREAYDAAFPSIVEKDISVAMPASALAAYLYEDTSREDEILVLNRIRNPFMVPAGTRLKVHGK